MRLNKLKLENFCHHRSLTVDFPVGITGVVGPNGSGKSTISSALKFALTGNSGNAGTKADDLNWAAAAEGKGGFVELAFEAGGQPGKIKRTIQKANATLKHGDTAVRSASCVSEYLGRLLNMSSHTLDDIVFVRQGLIESLLFSRPAERKKNMHALFGVGRAESIREALRTELSTLGVVAAADEQILQLQQRLEQDVDKPLGELAAERKAAAEALAAIDVDAARAVLTAHGEALRIHVESQELAAACDQLREQRNKSKHALDQLTPQLEQLQGRHKAEQQSLADKQARRAVVESSKRLVQTKSQLLNNLEAAKQVANTPPPTPPEMAQEDIDVLAKEVSTTRTSLEPKRTFVQTFFEAKEATPTCPTCGQDVHNAASLASEMREALVAWERDICQIEQDIATATRALRAYHTAKEQHAAQVSSAQATIAQVQQQLEQLGDVDYDPNELATLDAELQAFEQLRTQLEQLQQQANKLSQDVAVNEASIESEARRLAGLMNQSLEAPSEADVEAAQQTVQTHERSTAALSTLDGRIAQLQTQRESILRELQGLTERTAKLDALKEYQSFCERGRTVLHHDCLPQVATQAYLGQLNARLAQYLETFNVPFTAAVDEDLSVICSTPDAGNKPAERLSGGQKVMLSIAYRFAVYSLFAADLGFMVLDEPTIMLDADRVASVVEVLHGVRRYAHNTGMQLVVITHEPELVSTFDHTVYPGSSDYDKNLLAFVTETT